ncbi:hypothetical protein VTL71DRAFT_15922 [Oculimacula yallundae]|uniref:Uncharacterized protein n=1 Tax=Oculimacula yallundae TaxID=86028 RepID=A0ABR4CDK1_9HELO
MPDIFSPELKPFYIVYS